MRHEHFEILAGRWDVTAAKELVKGRTPNTDLNVKQTASWLSLVHVDEERVMTDEIDITVPVILITIPCDNKEAHLPIDGWHRIAKAAKLGVQTIPGHVLTLEESDKVRLSPRVLRI
jgi:hypothetical protein